MVEVSVIIPVYNAERYLRRCLDSVLDQDFDNFEVICIDDCSQDNSKEILNEYSKKYSDIVRVLINKENVGCGKSRDIAYSCAKGKFVTYVDSDDYIDKDFLSVLVRFANEEKADIVLCPLVKHQGRKTLADLPNPNDKYFIFVYYQACAKLFRKDFLDRYGITFLGVRRYEDEGFTLRCLSKKPAIYNSPFSAYHYCINDNSITHSGKTDRSKIFVEYTKTLVKTWKDVNDTGAEIELIKYYLASHLVLNFLYNCKYCSSHLANKLYARYRKTLFYIDPQIYNNPYLSAKPFKKESFLRWVLISLFIMESRFKMDKLMFGIWRLTNHIFTL